MALHRVIADRLRESPARLRPSVTRTQFEHAVRAAGAVLDAKDSDLSSWNL